MTGFPGGSDGEESACNVGDLDLIPGLGRSPKERNGYPLQCFCLGNPMERGIWWALGFVPFCCIKLMEYCFAMLQETGGSVPGLGRSSGEANGDPLQYSCLVRHSSVAQLCLTLCDPMNCSTPGLPVHHQLLEFTQTHVHRVSDAIQPSHPLSSPSPPAPNPSQHQSLFQ